MPESITHEIQGEPYDLLLHQRYTRCLFAFQNALDIIISHLNEENTALILLGDYIHGGKENAAVLDKIMELQNRYGSGKSLPAGNHEELVCEGMASVDACGTGSGDDDRYVSWLRGLPRYHAAGKTIFVHAGIDEEAEDLWKYGTMDHIFMEKYPAQTGHFFEDYKIVAGHISTSAIAEDPHFHGIYLTAVLTIILMRIRWRLAS